MIRIGRPYHFKYFKGRLPQILLGPLYNTLSQIIIVIIAFNNKLIQKEKKMRQKNDLGKV